MQDKIKNLGERTFPSPLHAVNWGGKSPYVNDETRMLYNVYTDYAPVEGKELTFELAGPREQLYFDPVKTRSAIVTCGGVCPGLNDVIRSIVMVSHYYYGASSIFGIRYGYGGLNPSSSHKPIELHPELVEDIHKDGGTMLGSSRGGTEDMNVLVDTLEKMKINILYTIGGDGTLRGAHKIAEICGKRGLNIAVIGIPKTIDNDISYIQRSFGFETAFSIAGQAIMAAHVEAKGAPNGIGLVKLMGRHSGFIAANAALAMNDVNFVMVPEDSFDLCGENGFLQHLKKRILKRAHAVICVAEGAGQEMLMKEGGAKGYDASGNVKLDDIGLFLKDEINRFFKKEGIEINLKYIDPSYIIRSAPAVPGDSVLCALLGQNAVHAGMAGKTDMIIGIWNNIYTHVPIELAISKRKQIDPHSKFWYSVLTATGQPLSMRNS
ncbi:MAG TPA: ATP-dependent 6-phosphofructokinase [Spirochaetota bacterium]|nr:ATP-dependent 6-phosphofructokinase [Spirochaetota bacterium]